MDSELLTDIAAIYLGLGKLILNGHRNVKKETKNKQKITYKLQLGYVQTHYLGFVYKMICDMRNIPEDEYNSNLTSQSKIYIAQAMNHNEFSPYLKQNFFDYENASKTIAYMIDVLCSIQTLLNDIDKNLSSFDELTAKKIQSFLIESHQKLFKYCKFVSNFVPNEYTNERFNFLYNAKAYHTLDEMLVSLDTVYNFAKECFDFLQDKEENQTLTLGSNHESNLFTIICRNDGTKISHTVGNPLFVAKCPACGYQFMASTDAIFHYNEVKDFAYLYNNHFVRVEPTSKIIEDQGFIMPILSFLKYNKYISLALIFILIGVIVLIITHIYFSLFFFAVGLVYIIVHVFDLEGVNLPPHLKFRSHRYK